MTPESCPLIHDSEYLTGWETIGVNFDGACVAQHVVPCGDHRQHQLDPTCWCAPVEDIGSWVHNSLDGREAYETGRRKAH